MKFPRVRFTVRRVMVAVASLAVFIGALRAATRPIPVAESVNTVTGEVRWSDGVVAIGHHGVARPMETSDILSCRLVRWSDGSISLRLPMDLGALAILLAILVLPAVLVAGVVGLIRTSRALGASRRAVATLAEENRRLREEVLAHKEVGQAEVGPNP